MTLAELNTRTHHRPNPHSIQMNPNETPEPPKGYRSVAIWPEGTLSYQQEQKTTDDHGTRESAEGVCNLLERNGFGGDRKVFPLCTYVEPIYTTAQPAEQTAEQRIAELERENERLTKAAVPLCIGQPIIQILAREGQWLSEAGQGAIAADCLFRKDPYEELAQLRAERDALAQAQAEAAALRERCERALDALDGIADVTFRKAMPTTASAINAAQDYLETALSTTAGQAMLERLAKAEAALAEARANWDVEIQRRDAARASAEALAKALEALYNWAQWEKCPAFRLDKATAALAAHRKGEK